MNGDDRSFRRVDVALWVGITAGLWADTYLPWAAQGWFVRSPVGLLWPFATAAALLGIGLLNLSPIRERSAGTLLLVALAGLWCCALVALSLVPPVARDELTHHLAIPALFIRAGRVYEIPYADQSYYPMLLTLLYTPLLAQGWENAAKFLHMGFGLAASGLVCTYLQPRVRTWLASLAGVLLLTTPTVTVLSASAYVDLGLLFYATAAILALVRWSETQRPSLLLACALSCGCAATVKYNGFLVIPTLGAAVVLLSQDRPALLVARRVLTFGLVSLVPLLPWLVKNLLETGNPVFPLLTEILGGRPLPSRPAVDLISQRRLIYGESWLAVVLTPVRVFLTGREGDPARFDGAFNPLLLLGFAAAWLPGATRRTWVMAGFAAVFLLLVFFLAVFRSRYAVPVLAPLVVLSVQVMDAWSKQGQRWQATVAALSLGALLFNAGHLALFWTRIDPIAYLSGRESRATFISRFVPEYPVAIYANAHLPHSARVYLAFLGQRGYYWQRSYTYDFSVSGVALQRAAQGATRPADIADSLRRSGITHIASADRLLARFMRDNLNDLEHQRWEQFVRTHLQRLYRHGGIGLYEIV